MRIIKLYNKPHTYCTIIANKNLVLYTFYGSTDDGKPPDIQEYYKYYNRTVGYMKQTALDSGWLCLHDSEGIDGDRLRIQYKKLRKLHDDLHICINWTSPEQREFIKKVLIRLTIHGTISSDDMKEVNNIYKTFAKYKRVIGDREYRDTRSVRSAYNPSKPVR